jgi:hypothetical protein
MNHLPREPGGYLGAAHFDFIRKFAKIFAAEGAPPLSTTLAAS